jgi:uncharacterized integral membrane protein
VKLLTTLLAAALALVVILFAVSNRMPVTLEVWPFPFAVTLGLYAVVLLSALLGFLVGVVAHWLMASEQRRELRRRRAQVRDLEQSLARLKETPPR